MCVYLLKHYLRLLKNDRKEMHDSQKYTNDHKKMKDDKEAKQYLYKHWTAVFKLF